MKQLITKFILFVVFFSIIYVTVIVSILFVNRTYVKKQRIENNITTIIVGDSHTMWSIDDSKLNGVRNISLNAEGYLYTYTKLAYLLEQDNKIKKLYLGFSYHNLSGYYDDYIYGKQSLYFFFRYIEILGLKEYLELFVSNPKNIVYMSPILLRKGLENIATGNSAFLGSFPAEGMIQKFDPLKMQKRIMDQYYQNGSVVSFSKMNIDYLNRIIDLCKKNNIKVVLIKTPQQTDYNNSIPRKYIDAYNNFISKQGLSVYNFSDLKLADSCFLPDGDHVNSCGAAIVTDYFRKHLENGEASEMQ